MKGSGEISALAGGEDRLTKGMVVASNRQPYVHQKRGSGSRVEVPAGGVVSALDTVLRHIGGTWVAWGNGSADWELTDCYGRVAVPPFEPSYTLRRLRLDPQTVRDYYHGFANRVLWPVCHGEPGRGFFRDSYWEGYLFANKAFAEAIQEEGGEESPVWLHDYHLCLVPALIREASPKRSLAHFWHIPWPAPHLFYAMPHAGELLCGLLGNDLICFQTARDAENFLECASSHPGTSVERNSGTISFKGNLTRVKSFPVSIDFARFSDHHLTCRAISRMNRVAPLERLAPRIGIGVDRLDFSKGLVQKLQAIELFFQRYRSFRGAFTFIQVCVMTRSGEPYLSYQREVEELVARINGTYGTDTWQPVIYHEKPLAMPDLVAWYRRAEVAVVTPHLDGMNLVAKEYAASRNDGDGVLILGQDAGAADELKEALLVEPADVKALSQALHRALTMPRKERRARMERLRERIQGHTIYHWIGEILHEIQLIPLLRERGLRHPLEHRQEISRRLAGQEIFLCLDFDGTLAPIVERPELASMPQDIRALLVRLRERYPVAIISGRALWDVRARAGVEGVIYGGNHGAELEVPGESPLDLGNTPSRLAGFLVAAQTLSRFPGVLIEDKGVTASIHYRLLNPSRLAEFSDVFWELAGRYSQTLLVTEGRKVFEIRPVGLRGKGETVSWLMERVGKGRTPVYIGDDTADEAAFVAVRGKGIAVAVGGSRSAEFNLGRQSEVGDFLDFLVNLPYREALVPKKEGVPRPAPNHIEDTIGSLNNNATGERH